MKTKIRAWDKYLKKMFHNVNPIFDADGNLDFIIYEYGNTGHDMIEIDLKKWDSSMLYHYDEGIPVELMQYTGLKDSNGVEIYEGDVVSHDQGEYSFVGYVARDCYTFFIKGISQLESLGFEDVADTSKGTADLTIIGNIYQNKELLEGK